MGTRRTGYKLKQIEQRTKKSHTHAHSGTQTDNHMYTGCHYLKTKKNHK